MLATWSACTWLHSHSTTSTVASPYCRQLHVQARGSAVAIMHAWLHACSYMSLARQYVWSARGRLGRCRALVGIYVLTAALFSRCDYFVWWSLGGCDFFLDAVAEYCTVACCRPILYVRTARFLVDGSCSAATSTCTCIYSGASYILSTRYM